MNYVVIDGNGKRVWPEALYSDMQSCLEYIVNSKRNDLRVFKVG